MLVYQRGIFWPIGGTNPQLGLWSRSIMAGLLIPSVFRSMGDCSTGAMALSANDLDVPMQNADEAFHRRIHIMSIPKKTLQEQNNPTFHHSNIGGWYSLWLMLSVTFYFHPYEGWRYFISGWYRLGSISNVECVKHLKLLSDSHFWLSMLNTLMLDGWKLRRRLGGWTLISCSLNSCKHLWTPFLCWVYRFYPLVNVYMAMEHHHF